MTRSFLQTSMKTALTPTNFLIISNWMSMYSLAKLFVDYYIFNKSTCTYIY